METFELGTPAVYGNVSGEIIMNKEDVVHNGLTYSPNTIKGIKLYKDHNYSGDGYRFIIPDWDNVKTFNEKNEEERINSLIKEGLKTYNRYLEIDKELQKIAGEEVVRLVELNKFKEAKLYLKDFYKDSFDKDSETCYFFGRDLLKMYIIRQENKFNS